MKLSLNKSDWSNSDRDNAPEWIDKEELEHESDRVVGVWVNENGSGAFWIREHESGSFSTVIERYSEYGTFEECVNLINYCLKQTS